MSNLLPGNQKHLTLENRFFIEKSLNERRSFKEIARYLCKDPTTISKEVKVTVHVTGTIKVPFLMHTTFVSTVINVKK